jgi:hypothetical protein
VSLSGGVSMSPNDKKLEARAARLIVWSRIKEGVCAVCGHNASAPGYFLCYGCRRENDAGA